jgi:predicted outer membrane protein
MRAMPMLRATFLRVFFLFILICTTSCKKNNQIENTLKNETFNKNDREQTEAFFFIATANLSKAIISKCQLAQQKASKSIIRQLSRKIENHQNNLLKDIAKMANKRLVIVTEINNSSKLELYKLIDSNETNFDKVYVDSMLESLNEQVDTLESVSKETNDEVILKLVLQYLPELYQFLRETEQIKQQIN